MGLTPQLHPTDVEALEAIDDREERETAYNDNAIYRENDARGSRYVKGRQLGARPRGWQSLDLVLRSDRNSAAVLPERRIRTARVLTGLLAASALVIVGGAAASAREGLDLTRLNGTGAVLLTGGVLTLGFGIGAGIAWGRARSGYEAAVDVYNDSLGLRLGIYDADGQYRPPEGVLVDEEGFIILDQRELNIPGVAPVPAPAPVVNPPVEFEPETGDAAVSGPEESGPDASNLVGVGVGVGVEGRASMDAGSTARLVGPSRG